MNGVQAIEITSVTFHLMVKKRVTWAVIVSIAQNLNKCTTVVMYYKCVYNKIVLLVWYSTVEQDVSFVVLHFLGSWGL